VIVCQTQEQRRALKQHFGRDGIVVENPIDVEEFDRAIRKGEAPAEPHPAATLPLRQTSHKDRLIAVGSPDATTSPAPGSPQQASRPVLWIGRAEAIHKRPMQAVEIARRVPELRFLLVMNPRDPAEEARAREAAPPNVSIVAHVPPPEMPALMARSAALLNTSSLEGFPNTFLQAAAARIPVVSLSVGDAFLEQSGAGVYCHDDLDRAASELRRLVAEPSMATEMGNRGRAWVETHHAAAARAAELRNVLVEAVNRAR